MPGADDIVLALAMTSDEAARRLAADGPNELVRAVSTSSWRIFARQFESPVVWLLVVAAVASIVLGELADAIAIAAVLVVNATVGFAQELRADRAIDALRSVTAPRARVIRDGRTVVIASREVVVGDVLVLEAGDIVAADASVARSDALAANEATLTGESVPVDKTAGSDRVFLGTSITSGTGEATVTATGMASELGAISRMVETAKPGSTPLQDRLARVNRQLIVASIGIVAVVGVADLARGRGIFDVFLGAVALAVAAVPEGLPAIVTIALALGTRRMAARHALVRALPAVETLGSTTVICTDKTGTLTTGRMAVRELWAKDDRALLDAAAACCDAELATGVGDPTELAILAMAATSGIERAAIERDRPRVHVTPFDPVRKVMEIERADGCNYVKGAVEVVVPRCSTGAAGALEAANELAARGLRVLAVASGTTAPLTLLGLVGIADPPRPEAAAAVATAHAAGIRTIMITGDHPATANAIARELGITTVHARATPADKLRIVRELKAQGDVVAMTGDGVNDAPALREAHVGIAMGKGGTDVTREVSQLVLADDNFASIVAAIREGRGIFENIRKALVYLLAGNVAELGVMLVAALAGLPLPLLPLQLLWINLVTDGLPALALVAEPVRGDSMTRPPRPVAESILGRAQWRTIVVGGAVEGVVTLAAFAWTLQAHDLATARTVAFSVLVFSQMLAAFAFRSTTRVLWQLGAWTNVMLLVVAVLSIAAQVALDWIPVTRHVFALAPLSLNELAACLAVAAIPVTFLEVLKLVNGLPCPGARHARC